MKPPISPYHAKARLYCALDTADLDDAMTLARELEDVVGGYKLGLEFFSAHGPDGVADLSAVGLPIFLDLKLHDIPNTVAGAVKAAGVMGVDWLTIHTSGGPQMLRAAVAAAAGFGPVDRPRLLGVTVLTSLDDGDLEAVGQERPALNQVQRLARLAQASGLDGVVCAPHEVAAVRAACGSGLTIVTPGIRPAWSVADDQKRAATPAEALGAGADILVLGRPITRAVDPVTAARRVLAEVGMETG